jgi:6-phosphogluconolactonase (cycloisomerase 2 family)
MGVMSRWVLAAIGLFLVAALFGCSNSNNNNNSPATGFMWVATQGDKLVRAYTIDLNSGTVRQVGGASDTGIQPAVMTTAPGGATIFMVNSGDDSVTLYSINSDGSICTSPPSGKQTCPAVATVSTLSVLNGCSSNCGPVYGHVPVAVAVDPTGQFLFVADQGQANDVNNPGGISVFSISGTSLTPVGPACPANYSQSVCPFVLTDSVSGFGLGPSGIAVSPAGNFLYVTDQFTNDVSVLSYDTSGALTLITTCAQNCLDPRIPVGSNPVGIAFSRCAGATQATANCPTGADNVLFVANSGSQNVSAFTACIQANTTCSGETGALSAVSGSPFAAGTGPISIIPDPVADVVYALDRASFQVSQYSFSPATGALSALSPATASTGSFPISAGITTDGKWFFVANNGASNLSAYGVGTAGRLNAASTSSVSVPNQPSAVLIR